MHMDFMQISARGFKNNKFVRCCIALNDDGSDVTMSEHSFASDILGETAFMHEQDECIISLELLVPENEQAYRASLQLLISKGKSGNMKKIEFEIQKDFSILCDKHSYNIIHLKKWISKKHFNVIHYSNSYVFRK